MKQRIFLFLGLALILGYGCNEDDLVQLDPTRAVPENFFQNAQQLESTVLSTYAPLRSQPLVGRLYFFLNDASDDFHAPTSALFPVAQALTRGQQTSASGDLGQHWSALYLMIHRANTAIEGIEGNETVEDAVKNSLLAEARFLRGWAYNELATKWGGVPIYTARVKDLESFQPRSTREESFALAQSDLQFAAENLPDTREGDQQGRVTRGGALGILARSYMEVNNLSAARTALEEIVNSGQYSLLDDFYDNFTEENGFTSESLFEVVYAPIGDYAWSATGDETNAKSVRAQEYGPSWRNITPSSDLVNLFENELAGCSYTDPRLAETVIFEGDTYGPGDTLVLGINENGPKIDYHGEEVFANWYKYEVYYKQAPGGYYTTTTNYIVMRYADVLLLLAEIEAREGNLDQARDYMNQVRERAGVPDIEESCLDNDSQDELIEAIIDERGKELASEAIRARDLRRWDRYGVIDASDYLSYWGDNDKQLLWPIPLQELITNDQISEADQNPGY